MHIGEMVLNKHLDLLPGVEFLTGARPASEALGVLPPILEKAFDVDLGARISHLSERFSVMCEAACTALVAYIDTIHDGETINFSIKLTEAKLVELVGEQQVATLLKTYQIESQKCGAHPVCAEQIDEIVLLRMEAENQVVNWHRDDDHNHAAGGELCVMQVGLVDDTTFEGGRLTFLTCEGMIQPAKPAGSATVHPGNITHAVSQMTSGVRYGLYFFTYRSTSIRSNSIPRYAKFGRSSDFGHLRTIAYEARLDDILLPEAHKRDHAHFDFVDRDACLPPTTAYQQIRGLISAGRVTREQVQ
jgi:hypothetical protein